MAKIPFYKPTITEEDKKAVLEVLESGWLTSGPNTEAFEVEFAKYIGAPFCVATNSCSNALFLCLEYLKEIGDPRIKYPIAVPSLTCSATAHAIKWAGLRGEFVDIDRKTFAMLPTNSPSIPVHYAGKYNEQQTVVVEDSAHRLVPNSFKGNLTCYSFYVTKPITSGEGGMIACRTQAEKDWFISARLYGISEGAWRRNTKRAWDFKINFVGWKCNPIDLTMALGRSQLKRADELYAERKRVADRYDELLGEKHDWEANHLYPIVLNNRDEFIEEMKAKEMPVSVHFPPLHIQPAYSYSEWNLPNTMWVYDHIVSLPIWPYMPDEMIVQMATEVNSWRQKYGKTED